MRDIAETILRSGYKIGMVVTGGGAQILTELTKYGGASNSLLYFYYPYDMSFVDELNDLTENVRYNSIQLAEELARQSLKTNNNYGFTKNLVLGATCSLIKENQRESRENSCNLVILSDTRKEGYYLNIDPKVYTERSQQEALVANFGLKCLLHFITGENELNYVGAEATILN